MKEWVGWIVRFCRRPVGWALLAVVEAVLLCLLIWRPAVLVPLDPSRIQHSGNNLYAVTIPRLNRPGYSAPADSNERPNRSTLNVLRDGQRLGPAHAAHQEIMTRGGGAFSHWGEILYFSTPDNADPRTDGHLYAVQARLEPVEPFRIALLVTATLVALFLVLGALPWIWTSLTRLTLIATHARDVAHRYRGFLKLVLIALLLALEGGALALLFWRPVIEVPLARERIVPVEGHSFAISLSDVAPFGYRLIPDTPESPRQSTLEVLHDGRPAGPAHTAHAVIAAQGKGAFSHWGDTLYFSAPGNTDPRTDGQRYAARGELTPAPLLLVSLIASSILFGGVLVWSVLRWLSLGFGSLVGPLKLGALATLGAVSPWVWQSSVAREMDRLTSAGHHGLLVLYVATFGLSIIGLIVVPFLGRWHLRIPLSALLLAGFAVDRVMVTISGQPMALDMMQTLWRERAMAGGVLEAYKSAIASSGALVALLVLPFMLPPGRWGLKARFAAIPLFALVAVAAIVHWTRGRTEAFPSSFLVPAQFALTQIFSESPFNIERLPVDYKRPLQPGSRKIVMIVDESVRGDYLGFNNPAYDNTPTLSRMAEALANYGVATSASNCSVAARLIMRVGLQRPQLPDTRQVWRRMPTIWQHAKEAGYKTVLVDAWRPVGAFHSYMDKQEAEAIDLTISVSAGPESGRDQAAARVLSDLLQRDEQLFIYVNKWGTHREYHTTFPADLPYDPSRLVASLPLDASRRAIVADYHKALRWSVDAFFEALGPALQRDDTVLLYTSDHGQSLFEGGYDLSHCSLSTSLHRGEVLVPLFVATGSPRLRGLFKEEAHRAFGRASHFEVFPTLLELMGYSRDWVGRTYGPSLLTVPVDRKRGFVMGTFFQPGAVWLDADQGP